MFVYELSCCGFESSCSHLKNIVTKISYNKYKDFLLNKKRLRHSMNRIQSNNPRLGTYQIKKIYLSRFDNKTCCLELMIRI